MIILFIVGLLLGIFSVVFALQNIAVVTVTFFNWHLTGSQALILLLAIGLGIFITLLLLLPEFISNYFRYRSLEKENKKLTENLRKQKELNLFDKKTINTSEQMSKIEQSAIDHLA
jgi:uncharacterized integral membrane protein